MSEVRAQLTELAKLIVDEPAEVMIDEFEDGDATVFELGVAPQDLGKVIGRQGRTARALRSLLDARGERDNVRYELDIIED